MKIALIGYGKMGKAIEKIAVERGHEVPVKITADDAGFGADKILGVDVAIDFTIPECAKHNILTCFEAGVPVVVGTTGWYDDYGMVSQSCEEQNGAMLCATNFSIGVNIFFEINKRLSSLLGVHDYDVSMKEIHHTEKLDAPSGTAITLAEGVIENHEAKSTWVNNATDKKSEVGIVSERLPEVPGTHEIVFESEIDIIRLEHEAKNRKGFALGSVVAAEFLAGKSGIYSMKDVLNIEA